MPSVTAQTLADDALVAMGVQKAGSTISGIDASFALRTLNRAIGRLTAAHAVQTYSAIGSAQTLSDTQESMLFWALVVALSPSYGVTGQLVADFRRLAGLAERAARKDIAASPAVSSDDLGGPPYERFNILRRTSS